MSTCSICFNICSKPIQCNDKTQMYSDIQDSGCKNWFCQNCIVEWRKTSTRIERSLTCPTCRSEKTFIFHYTNNTASPDVIFYEDLFINMVVNTKSSNNQLAKFIKDYNIMTSYTNCKSSKISDIINNDRITYGTALHAAVYLHDIDKVKFLLDNGFDINLKDYSGSNVLMTNIHSDKVIDLLIDSQIDILHKNYNSETPLYFAVKYNNTKLVKRLVDLSAIDDIISVQHSLSIAAAKGHFDTYKYIIDSVDQKIKCFELEPALDYLTNKYNLEMIKEHYQYKENFKKAIEKSIYPAVYYGDYNLIEYIMKRDVSYMVKFTDRRVLDIALRSLNANTLLKLLNNGIDIFYNKPTETLFFTTALSRILTAFEHSITSSYLPKIGVFVDHAKKNTNPMLLNIFNLNRYYTDKIVIDFKSTKYNKLFETHTEYRKVHYKRNNSCAVYVDDDGAEKEINIFVLTLMYYHSLNVFKQEYFTDILTRLLDFFNYTKNDVLAKFILEDIIVPLLIFDKTLINLLTEGHMCETPILYGAYLNNINIIKLFREYRADINVVNDFHRSILHLAVSDDINYDCITYVLSFKEIDVNAKDDAGNTALHYCVEGKKSKVLDLLFERDDLDINIVNNDGNTALMHAVRMNQNLCVKKICNKFQNKIKTTIKNNARKNIFHLINESTISKTTISKIETIRTHEIELIANRNRKRKRNNKPSRLKKL